MPTKYKRKVKSQRALWSENDLKMAIEAIETKTLGVNAAAKHFNIPKATLIRRKNSGNLRKTGLLGPSSTLGEANEAKLVTHIKKLQKFGFAPTRNEVRHMAFALAEQLELKHRFDITAKVAGYDWLRLFLSRNPDLSIRIAEGVSVNRSTALCRNTVNDYFELLETILNDNQLFDKPGNIFNVDETGLQLNNRPGQVVAAKGSKAVTSITSGEKGETISVIACCNGEGTFLPPYCIFKGKNMKPEFSSGMPPGSVVRMSQKSAYVNTHIFFNWLKEHFMPRKPEGKVLLILDGHTSHCNLCEMLEFAEENVIIMLCLPPHTTHYLQPLDRAVFKSLKSHYYTACNNFIKTNPSRKIGRLQFGQLLSESWTKAAVAKNAISGFQATGIIPFSPEAIPDYAFLSEDVNGTGPESRNARKNNDANEAANVIRGHESPQPGCSHWEPTSSNKQTYMCSPDVPAENKTHSPDPLRRTDETITPGKMLDLISPIPKCSEILANTKRRGRAVAQVLTSPDHIALRKIRQVTFNKKTLTTNIGKPEQKIRKITSKRISKKRVVLSSSSESEGDVSLRDDSDTIEEWDENNCAGCGENYAGTQKSDDWVQCISCPRWLHESCFKYEKLCPQCGKKNSSTSL